MRYKASTQVEHSCCYAVSVIDLNKPRPYDDVLNEQNYVIVCECRNMETAEIIAKALNELNSQGMIKD